MSEETEPLLGPANAAAANVPGATPHRGLPDPIHLVGKPRAAGSKAGGGDPMIQHGSKSVKKGLDARNKKFADMNRSEVVTRLALIVGLPTLTFALTLLVVLRLYVYWPIWVFGWALLVSTAVIYAQRNQAWRQEHQHRTMHFVAFALALGFIFAFVMYYHHMVYYYRYRDLRRHTNVAGSQPADKFADAGMLMFTEDTKVDVSRAIGYLSIPAKATLCVAPIVDSSSTPSDPVTFFAVGKNCCGWRGNFECGDVGNAAARGGMLLLDTTTLSDSPALEFFMDDSSIREGFTDALTLEKASFGTIISDQPRFVRWTQDPVHYMNGYWWAAFLYSFFAVGGFAVCLTYYVVKHQGSPAPPPGPPPADDAAKKAGP